MTGVSWLLASGLLLEKHRRRLILDSLLSGLFIGEYGPKPRPLRSVPPPPSKPKPNVSPSETWFDPRSVRCKPVRAMTDGRQNNYKDLASEALFDSGVVDLRGVGTGRALIPRRPFHSTQRVGRLLQWFQWFSVKDQCSQSSARRSRVYGQRRQGCDEGVCSSLNKPSRVLRHGSRLYPNSHSRGIWCPQRLERAGRGWLQGSKGWF